jgi:hypothetical protein
MSILRGLLGVRLRLSPSPSLVVDFVFFSQNFGQKTTSEPNAKAQLPLPLPPSQAREGSYFKSEQEDELSAYRRRRIREGALDPNATPTLLDGESVGLALSRYFAFKTRSIDDRRE